MSYDAKLDYNKQMFSELSKGLEQLRRGSVMAGARSMARIAKAFEVDIKQRYKEGPGAPLATSTQQKRQQGKRRGITPAIPPMPGPPLHRSGRMISLVQMTRKGTPADIEFQVRIRPGIQLPHGGKYGGRSDMVAMTHEFGQTVTIRLTAKARVYLIALARGIAGKAENPEVTAASLREMIVTVKTPARPVWVPAIMQLTAEQPFGPRGFVPVFVQELRRTVKLPFNIVFG